MYLEKHGCLKVVAFKFQAQECIMFHFSLYRFVLTGYFFSVHIKIYVKNTIAILSFGVKSPVEDGCDLSMVALLLIFDG